MAQINVNRQNPDQFYRYKMPRLISKVEGSGNGIKTVIANMVDIAKALNRPPTYPTKYFGCELGAQTHFDFLNERYIVNGSHDASKLQDLLDGFIEKFVLCPQCENPETDLKVKKNQIGQRCLACGHQGFLLTRHRLITFIIKNPPEMDPKAQGTSITKRKEKDKKKSHQNGEGDEDPNASLEHEDDEEEWSVDTSKEAVAERMKDLSGSAKGLTLNDDLEKSQQKRLEIFYNYIKKLKEDGKIESMDKEITVEAERLDVKEKGPLVLVELLLDENIIKQLKTFRKHFLRFTLENEKAQKYFLGGIELITGNVHPEKLLPKVATILKTMYDLDLVEEEVLLEWAKKPSKKYVSKEVAQKIHDKAAPFIKWLQEAEEDSSEQEEEDVQIAFSNRIGNSLKVVKDDEQKPSQKDPKSVPAEDDFDIDDI